MSVLNNILGDVAAIRQELGTELQSDAEFHGAVLSRFDTLISAVQAMAADVVTIRKVLTGEEIVGIAVDPGSPVPRSRPITTSSSPGDSVMAKTPTVKLVKAASKGLKAGTAKKAAGPVLDFAIQDNQDDTCTVMGVDAAGAQVDISAAATITDASDNTAALTVDPPTGTTFAMHGVAPGSANVTVVATWNDGSIGPFTFTLPVSVSGGPATGIVVTPGSPTVR